MFYLNKSCLFLTYPFKLVAALVAAVLLLPFILFYGFLLLFKKVVYQYWFKPKPVYYRDKKKIERWLRKYKVENYQLEADPVYGYVVNVAGSVAIKGSLFQNMLYPVRHIPVRFQYVSGSFSVHNQALHSLESCPRKIGSHLEVAFNFITTLKGCPEIYGNLNLENNLLKNLEGSPRILFGGFHLSRNKLTSLKGAPEVVDGELDISYNQLTSLEGISRRVRNLTVVKNPLKTLAFFPQDVRGNIYFRHNSVDKIMLEKHLEYREWKILSPEIVQKCFWDQHIADKIEHERNSILSSLQSVANHSKKHINATVCQKTRLKI